MQLTRDLMVIRYELLAVPGALECEYEDCQVITQGGEEGMTLHLLYIHGVAPCQ